MEMDINVLRSVITLVSLAMFIGLIVWTWNRRQKRGFDEAAQLPFLDDDQVESTTSPRK
ncbi:MAG: cbb3-type cytochrome c oxidase subunit 3 [Vitreoscilla sp.]|nr:cbb3-type cytochrome c oxidase subunit 3 [Vitreoscilla sp.]MBP6674014.1 cbb3-type cytochrome c oxidase subunit 3 [Vitreoscilla sp.]